jgi:hypothetical protein
MCTKKETPVTIMSIVTLKLSNKKDQLTCKRSDLIQQKLSIVKL